MRKKTFKIFINSFAISLFTIWTFNELLAVSPRETKADITIPEENITLFLKDENVVSGSSVSPIKSLSLTRPDNKKSSSDKINTPHSQTFAQKKNKIDLTTEVADIPLEYSAEAKVLSKISVTAPKIPAKAEKSISLRSDNASASLDTSFKDNNIILPQNALNKNDKEVVDLLASVKDSQDFASSEQNSDEKNMVQIPLEFNAESNGSQTIEIADEAPQNQIAMTEGNTMDIETVTVAPMVEKDKISGKEWHELSVEEDSPWIVAQGTRNPKNNFVLEEKFYNDIDDEKISEILDKNNTEKLEQESVQVAEMVKNILIPIPDDILNDKNLTPQLVSPKKHINDSGEDEKLSPKAKEEKGGFFHNLSSIFGSSDNDEDMEEEIADEDNKEDNDSGFFSRFKKHKSTAKILPAEMRLAFQPGRAEISGTTLRWIQAFANKTIMDPNVIIEIRIDRSSSYGLQQKRLSLLHNILISKGVDYEKINTVFTSREPNSFIIRTLRIKEDDTNKMPKNIKKQNLYYQSW